MEKILQSLMVGEEKVDEVKRLFTEEKITNKSEIVRRVKIDVRNVSRILKES